MSRPEELLFALGLILLGSFFGSLIAFIRDRERRSGLAQPEPAPPGRLIYVDGSNVMHWGGQGPSVQPLILVLSRLQSEGFAPVVWFDANVGYKLADRHMNPADLARVLPVPASAIHLAPSGQPADPLVIEAALSRKARLVSNDRFMDWRAQFPGLRARHVLVKGSVRGARVDLTL